MGITTANIQDITSEEFEGTGIFDALMRSAKLHLEREYTENRIRGNDYATVYTSMLGSVLQASIQYSLEKPLREERSTAEIANITKQGVLIDAQASKLAVDEALVAQQDENLTAELANISKQGSLIDAQKLKVDADKALVAEQDRNLEGTFAHVAKQGLLLDAQVIAEQAKTDPAKGILGSAVALQRDILTKQRDKIDQEKLLLVEKTATERVQANGTPVAGSVVASQIALYGEQQTGYQADRVIKGAKLYTDVFSVQLSTNENTTTGSTGLDKPGVLAMMGKVVTATATS